MYQGRKLDRDDARCAADSALSKQQRRQSSATAARAEYRILPQARRKSCNGLSLYGFVEALQRMQKRLFGSTSWLKPTYLRIETQQMSKVRPDLGSHQTEVDTALKGKPVPGV